MPGTRHLVCCTLLTALAAAPVSVAASNPAPAPLTASFPKGKVSLKVLAGLKAGQPEMLTVSLDNSSVEAERDAMLQRKHIGKDDAEIKQMKQERYKVLKEQFLASYRPEDLQVVKDPDNVLLMYVRIHDLTVLKRLQDDPRVVYVGWDITPLHPT